MAIVQYSLIHSKASTVLNISQRWCYNHFQKTTLGNHITCTFVCNASSKSKKECSFKVDYCPKLKIHYKLEIIASYTSFLCEYSLKMNH